MQFLMVKYRIMGDLAAIYEPQRPLRYNWLC